jgi:8-oxo-dGTP pyrophosphatase MutT (NUDIX family)
MLRWRDPGSGDHLWEPPGGGIEDGETPYETAKRELVEETGLPADTVTDRSVTYDRDVIFNNKRFLGPEHFFLARFDTAKPAPDRSGLTPSEQNNLQDYSWVPWAAVGDLPNLRPVNFVAIVEELTA